MNSDDTNPRSQRIDAAIAEYLEAIERGAPPNREAFLTRHAEIAVELREFLADYSALKQNALQSAGGSEKTTDFSADSAKHHSNFNGAALDVLRYFGDYELVEEIARGGMGVVYKARQTTLNRTVAVKMILAGQLASQTEVDRFYAEAQAAATLDHPNIVPIYEVGQHQGQHYFSMGYVAGQSLAQQLLAGPLAPKEAATIVREVALAVHYAHGQGVIHRDIKPANILFDSDGHPRITDFGLAKRQTEASGLTATGQVLGTPSYMPPEQITSSSGQIGPTADVYSLGATLYALLTGRPPFQSASAIDTLKQVLEKEPVPLREFDASVPRDLETITLKCLEKSPDRRYSTAKELADELDRYLTGRPILARPVSRVEHACRWCRRNPVVASLTAAVALSLIVGALVSTYFAIQSSRRADDNFALAKTEAAAKGEAQSQQKRAEKNFELATESQRAAEENVRISRRQLYLNCMNLAQVAWEDSEIYTLLGFLKRTTPSNGEEDLRGFEWYYWNRLCHPDLMTLKGHLAEVRCVAFSPDGKRLASGSFDKTIKLWDSGTGQEVKTLNGHSGKVISVAFSPDGQWLASASEDKTIRLWDPVTGEGKKLLNGHHESVQSVAFSPDSQRLASGSYDQTVKLWEIATGKELATFQCYDGEDSGRLIGAVSTVAFSPDGQTLASGGRDQSIKLWDLGTGKATKPFKGYTYGVLSVAFSPDGQSLASSSYDKTIKLWDLATGRLTKTLNGHVDGVSSIAFSPDGKQLASASDDAMIKLWDVATGQEVMTYRGHVNCIESVAFSPDGKRLASASFDKTIKLHDLNGDQQPKTLHGHPGYVLGLEFSPDNQRLFSASGDGSIERWDVATGQETMALKGNTSYLNALVFSPDRNLLASLGGYPSAIKLWDVTTGQEIMTLKTPSNYELGYCLAFSPDGQRLAVSDRRMMIKLWNVTTGQETLTLKGHQFDILSLAFSPDGKRLASGSSDHTIKLWDLSNGQEMLSLEQDNPTSIAFSPDGRRLVVASGEVWDLGTKQKIKSLTGIELVSSLTGIEGGLRNMIKSPDGTRIASKGLETIALLDVVTGQETLILKGHHAHVMEVAFSPNGQFLASASSDGEIKLWDAHPVSAKDTPDIGAPSASFSQ